jgi:hypothetical protein
MIQNKLHYSISDIILKPQISSHDFEIDLTQSFVSKNGTVYTFKEPSISYENKKDCLSFHSNTTFHTDKAKHNFNPKTNGISLLYESSFKEIIDDLYSNKVRCFLIKNYNRTNDLIFLNDLSIVSYKYQDALFFVSDVHDGDIAEALWKHGADFVGASQSQSDGNSKYCYSFLQSMISISNKRNEIMDSNYGKFLSNRNFYTFALPCQNKGEVVYLGFADLICSYPFSLSVNELFYRMGAKNMKEFQTSIQRNII